MVPIDPAASPASSIRSAGKPVSEETVKDVNKRFEQMLWAEMLRHTGIEKAFTRAGGEAASAFTQFAVEAIAKDLAETQPFGFNSVERTAQAYQAFIDDGGANG
jgi:hypothetical protein